MIVPRQRLKFYLLPSSKNFDLSSMCQKLSVPQSISPPQCMQTPSFWRKVDTPRLSESLLYIISQYHCQQIGLSPNALNLFSEANNHRVELFHSLLQHCIFFIQHVQGLSNQFLVSVRISTHLVRKASSLRDKWTSFLRFSISTKTELSFTNFLAYCFLTALVLALAFFTTSSV